MLNAEVTMTSELPKFYNGWFCPYAQRAWIALLEKGVEFEYIEQDPYNKTPEWLAINPRGAVPAIVYKGKSVYESKICIEYVDEQWDTGKSILPSDAYQRAKIRILSDHIDKNIASSMFRALARKTDEERATAQKELVDGIKLLFEEFDTSNGPLFGGKKLGMLDIMLYPFAYRVILLLSHFRSFSLPKEGFEKFHQWYATASACASVQKTMPDDTKLIEVTNKKFKII